MKKIEKKKVYNGWLFFQNKGQEAINLLSGFFHFV